MQTRIVIVLVTLFLGVPSIALSITARAFVVCENGKHAVSVEGWYSDDGRDALYDGVVLKREAIGVCEPAEFIPSDPMPLTLLPYSGSTFTVEASATFDAPKAGVAYRYTPYGVLPDGSFESIYYGCDADGRNFAIANCDAAPIARGRLEFTTNCFSGICVQIVPCAEDCWVGPVQVDLTSFDGTTDVLLSELLGDVVDLFGDRTNCNMAGGYPYSISRIDRAPLGVCGPVPVREMNWGSLKATYR
jgi:hypothetical protein